MKRKTLAVALLTSCLGVLALVPVASAGVGAYTEPTYTKTTGNNSYWFNWTAVTGLNENGTSNYTYYLCLSTYQNNVQNEFSNGVNGPGSQNCTNSLRSGPTPTTGNNGFTPYTAGTVLADGARYEMCASGYRWYVYLWSYDNVACGSTIIDRNKPVLSATLAGGAAVTNNPAIPVQIGYSDATSPPWPGSNGYASNWVCIQQGSACAPTGNPDNNCSAPNGGFSNRINSFNCALNIGAGDGTYFFCTFGADAAIPDNPSGTNQFLSAFSGNANLSTTACDSVVLDRAGPAVTANASATTATVGELITFTMSASDPNGIAGAVDWDFGDNTPHGNSAVATHTYTQPGTYVAKARQADTAGNFGEGTITITVNPPSTPVPPDTGGTDGGTGGTDGGTGGTDGGTGGTDGGTGGTDGGTVVTPGSTEGTSGASPVPATTTQGELAQQVQQQAGGGGASTVDLGVLEVVAPKRFRAGKRRMLLAFTADQGGRLTVALLRRAKIVAKKGAAFGGPGTYTMRLKVPRKLKAVTHKLKITFQAAGAPKAITRTLKVRVVKRRSRVSSAPTSSGVVRGTRASRARRPQAVDPRAVDRTIFVR